MLSGLVCGSTFCRQQFRVARCFARVGVLFLLQTQPSAVSIRHLHTVLQSLDQFSASLQQLSRLHWQFINQTALALQSRLVCPINVYNNGASSASQNACLLTRYISGCSISNVTAGEQALTLTSPFAAENITRLNANLRPR